MKLYHLHEAKNLQEMTSMLDVPPNATPQPDPNQKSEYQDLNQRMQKLEQDQVKTQAAGTMGQPNIPQQARQMQSKAAVNTPQAPTPSDMANKDVHDPSGGNPGGPKIPTSLF